MSRKQTIQRLITDAEHRLRSVTKEARKIEAELAQLRERLEEVEWAEQQLALPLGSRTRGLSDKWATVLNFMVLRAPNPVSVDEVVAFSTENKLDMSRAAIRAQLHHYEKRGFVERVSDGLYLATSAARAYCEY